MRVLFLLLLKKSILLKTVRLRLSMVRQATIMNTRMQWLATVMDVYSENRIADLFIDWQNLK